MRETLRGVRDVKREEMEGWGGSLICFSVQACRKQGQTLLWRDYSRGAAWHTHQWRHHHYSGPKTHGSCVPTQSLLQSIMNRDIHPTDIYRESVHRGQSLVLDQAGRLISGSRHTHWGEEVNARTKVTDRPTRVGELSVWVAWTRGAPGQWGVGDVWEVRTRVGSLGEAVSLLDVMSSSQTSYIYFLDFTNEKINH